MSVLRLLEAMGVVALLVGIGMGVPVSAFLYLRRKPRRFPLWPILFATAAGASAPLFSLILTVVTNLSR